MEEVFNCAAILTEDTDYSNVRLVIRNDMHREYFQYSAQLSVENIAARERTVYRTGRFTELYVALEDIILQLKHDIITQGTPVDPLARTAPPTNTSLTPRDTHSDSGEFSAPSDDSTAPTDKFPCDGMLQTGVQNGNEYAELDTNESSLERKRDFQSLQLAACTQANTEVAFGTNVINASSLQSHQISPSPNLRHHLGHLSAGTEREFQRICFREAILSLIHSNSMHLCLSCRQTTKTQCLPAG
ncbi:hypothetical protein BU23DRAFT_7137 [Bimuria novae-zelandiae CBS 107.79]|uniref:Uncharacterized protein n=1 Tax=Bimuria novae-zelandiae CBS 107.79 TaxID=1447943 RepID=A0A6A5VUD6_9PLEO|nr:hypothetical protein BU23DRAFT_7137 [Bimuria novae-zelandiae CBS 107.79]